MTERALYLVPLRVGQAAKACGVDPKRLALIAGETVSGTPALVCGTGADCATPAINRMLESFESDLSLAANGQACTWSVVADTREEFDRRMTARGSAIREIDACVSARLSSGDDNSGRRPEEVARAVVEQCIGAAPQGSLGTDEAFRDALKAQLLLRYTAQVQRLRSAR